MLVTLVCRILNKLTPDNFDKLSFELARHAGINNKEILKGAILLVSFARAVENLHCGLLIVRSSSMQSEQ